MSSTSRSDPRLRARVVACAMFAAGFALWFAVSIVSGARDAMDSDLMWWGGMPAVAIATWIAARSAPVHAWRWPFVLFAGLFVGATVHRGELSNLWPIVIVFFAVMAAPFALFGTVIGARARRRAAAQ